MADAGLVQSNYTQDGNDATNSTVSFTSTPTSGNVLISFHVSGQAVTSFTVPSGWTLAYEVFDSVSSGIACAYKVSAGTETGDITWDSDKADGQRRTWIAEYSNLSGSTPFASSDGGSFNTLVSTGTTIATTTADVLAISGAGIDAWSKATTGRAWSNGFTSVHDDGSSNLGGGSPGIDVATQTYTAIQGSGVETTFSHTGSSDNLHAGVLLWDIAAASAAITSVGGDDVVLDAETPAFITTGFTSEISTVQLVSGTSTTNGSSVSSTSGTGTFVLPDITLYTGDVIGCPLTTTNNVVVARLTDA